jgi:hypothetical protein
VRCDNLPVRRAALPVFNWSVPTLFSVCYSCSRCCSDPLASVANNTSSGMLLVPVHLSIFWCHLHRGSALLWDNESALRHPKHRPHTLRPIRSATQCFYPLRTLIAWICIYYSSREPRVCRIPLLYEPPVCCTRYPSRSHRPA